MKFKPFSSKYDFSKTELLQNYPEHFHQPIFSWAYRIFEDNQLAWAPAYRTDGVETIKPEVQNRLQILFRQNFSSNFESFIQQVLRDSDLTSNFLALMLQNYATQRDAALLETVLLDGGSAYKVEKTDKQASTYDRGVYDLTKRVPQLTADQAKTALSVSEQLQDAWKAFYSLSPDYEKTVNKCCDALEHLLRDTYEPRNKKPQLGLLIKDLQTSPKKMNFKGDTLFDNKSDILTLIAKATTVRGSHTAGTGRVPTANEAELILHSTILLFNMHSGI